MSSTTVKDIAHDVQRDNPHLGSKADVEHLIKEVFEVILERTAKGSDVKVRGFGVFTATTFKGRTLKSPLMKGGEINFKDQLVLRFRQSQAAKIKINDIADKFKPTTKKTSAKPPADAGDEGGEEGKKGKAAESKGKKGAAKKGAAKKSTAKKSTAKKDTKKDTKKASKKSAKKTTPAKKKGSKSKKAADSNPAAE